MGILDKECSKPLEKYRFGLPIVEVCLSSALYQSHQAWSIRMIVVAVQPFCRASGLGEADLSPCDHVFCEIIPVNYIIFPPILECYTIMHLKWSRCGTCQCKGRWNVIT